MISAVVLKTAYRNEKERFGALNQQRGENPLNVAITRAKREIIIICSFDPYNISVDKVKNEGARRLKDYLCYAKAISESDREQAQNILSSLNGGSSQKHKKLEDSDLSDGEASLEKLVCDKLKDLGYQVDLEVGYSDLCLPLFTDGKRLSLCKKS